MNRIYDIDGYKILRELGRGGMGAVYEVEKFGQRYALKLLLDRSPDSALRFQQEARILASIDKDLPVVRCHSFGMSPLGPYMIMERIEGSTLKELLQSGPLRFDRALLFVAEVAETLALLHERGIIHRDIKADNIFVLANGQLRLGDFGLARLDSDDRLTQSQDFLGTPYAMAPEALHSARSVGPPADVWALAVLLYELLTTEHPFQSSTALELVKRISTLDYRSPSQLRPQLPQELDLLIQSCFQLEPKHRPTALILARQCRALASTPPPNRLRQKILPLTLGLLLSCALAFGANQLYHRWRQQQAQERLSAAILQRAANLERQIKSRLPLHFSDWLHEALAFQLELGPQPRDELFEGEWSALKSLLSQSSSNSPWPDSFPYTRLRARILGLEIEPTPNSNPELKLWEDALATNQTNPTEQKWNGAALTALSETLRLRPGSIPNADNLALFAGAALELQSQPDFATLKLRTSSLLESAELQRPWVAAFCERQSLILTIQQSLQSSTPTADLMRKHCRSLEARSKREGNIEAWLSANELIAEAYRALPKNLFPKAFANWMVYSSIDERLLWPPINPSQYNEVYKECMRRADEPRLGNNILPWHYRACILLLLSVPHSLGMKNQDGILLPAHQHLISAGDLIRGSRFEGGNPNEQEIFAYLSHALRAGLFLGRDYTFFELARKGTPQEALEKWPLPPKQKLSDISPTLLRARKPYLFMLCFGDKPHWNDFYTNWRRTREMLDELNFIFQSEPLYSQRLEAVLNRRILEHLSENFDEALHFEQPIPKLTAIAEALGFSTIPELQNWALTLAQKSRLMAIEDPRRIDRAEALLFAAAALLPLDASAKKSALESAALRLEAFLLPLETLPENLEQSFYLDTIYLCSRRLSELYFALEKPQLAAKAALFGWRILARANFSDMDLGELQILRLKAQPDSATRAKIISDWANWLRGIDKDKPARQRLIQSFESHSKQSFHAPHEGPAQK